MTASQTVEQPRTLDDIVRDLDLDDALRDAVTPPACEFDECGAPASWLQVGGCGCSGFACAPCKEQWCSVAATFASKGAAFCPRCKVAASVKWVSL